MARESKFPARDQHDGLDAGAWRWRWSSNSIDDLAQEIQLILKAKPPTDLREGWSLLKQGLNLLHARPKHVKEGACQEVVHLFEAEAPSSKRQAQTTSRSAICRS